MDSFFDFDDFSYEFRRQSMKLGRRKIPLDDYKKTRLVRIDELKKLLGSTGLTAKERKMHQQSLYYLQRQMK